MNASSPLSAAPDRAGFSLLAANTRASRYALRLIVTAVGALVATSFAPLQWWPFAIVCPAVLMVLWERSTPRHAAWLGFWFNLGTFCAGIYWIYTGVHSMGGAPIWMALGLMLALSSIMALYHAGLGYFVARWMPKTGWIRWLVGVPAAWVFVEWWRGWFLSGFAWLSLGYSQTDTWLASFAPIVGVYGISFILLVGSGALIALIHGSMRVRAIAAVLLIAPWPIGLALRDVDWTKPSGKPVAVAVAQGAVPQDLKWSEANLQPTLDLYRGLAEKAYGTPLIVFPEASLPDLANELLPYLRSLYHDASARGSSIVLGILRMDDKQKYYNSVLALGHGHTETVQWYDKSHLVPFAEFFPVPGFVRSWLRLMSLPYSDFTRGAEVQPPLSAGGLKLATTICYEDAYGAAMLAPLNTADTLVNVTNDAWFGHGSARYQHLQIARMRAIEAQRFMIRAGNDGISAVIGPRGEVVAEAPGFKPFVLRSEVTPRVGLPPYARFGNWLFATVAFLACLFALWKARQRTLHDAGAT